MYAADVVLIGGGIVASSIAYHLTAAGCQNVLVVERESAQGKGSTGKSMGGVRAQFSTPVNIQMSLYSIPFYASFEERLGYPCDYRPQGYLFCATHEKHMAYLRANHEKQAALGLDDARIISGDEIRELFPQLRGDDIVGGSFCSTDGFVDPNSAMVGFMTCASDHGASLWKNARATGIRRKDGSFEVATTRDTVSTRTVVNCAGAWAASIAKMVGIDLPVEPLRRMLVPTEPFDQFPHTAPMIIDMSTGFHFRPEGLGFLLAWNDPDETTGYKTDFDPSFVEKILIRAADRVPVFENIAVNPKRAWAGLYEMTPDHHPILGESPDVPGFFFANGFSGHGVMHSPATGKILSDLILTGQTDLIDASLLNFSRFAEGRNDTRDCGAVAQTQSFIMASTIRADYHSLDNKPESLWGFSGFKFFSNMPRELNYWLTTVQMPAGSAEPLPERADVAIVGAGYTGLSAALSLAKYGAKVVVLESETIGWGASSRNGGMVLTGLKLGVNQLISTYGRDLTRRMYAASLETIDTVEAIVKNESIECDFSRCGHLEVACKQAHFDDYARQVEVIAREFNHKLSVVPRDQLHGEIGSDIYYGGMVDEVSAGLNPARYVAGLGAAAIRAGAQVSERTRLQNIQRESLAGAPGFRLNTSRGKTWARSVLVGTSGYTGSATPALRKKVIPIGSFIIATEVLPEALAHDLSPRNRQIYDSKHYLYYYRLTPDNRMLFGGRAAFFPESGQTIRKSAEILRLGMIEVYPQLRDTKVEYVWGGTIDFCFDMMPHAGKIDGLYFALGYAGHGVAMATYQGLKMANWIADGETDNPFTEIPFPGAPLGLYNGKPWFLPFAGAYYKVLDWVS